MNRQSEPEKNLFKITYTDGDHKLNIYYAVNPLSNYESLIEVLHRRLFKEIKLPRCELRIYWLDANRDQMDILSDLDYYLFRTKYGGSDHLFVEPKAVKKEGKEG